MFRPERGNISGVRSPQLDLHVPAKDQGGAGQSAHFRRHGLCHRLISRLHVHGNHTRRKVLFLLTIDAQLPMMHACMRARNEQHFWKSALRGCY